MPFGFYRVVWPVFVDASCFLRISLGWNRRRLWLGQSLPRSVAEPKEGHEGWWTTPSSPNWGALFWPKESGVFMVNHGKSSKGIKRDCSFKIAFFFQSRQTNTTSQMSWGALTWAKLIVRDIGGGRWYITQFFLVKRTSPYGSWFCEHDTSLNRWPTNLLRSFWVFSILISVGLPFWEEHPNLQNH